MSGVTLKVITEAQQIQALRETWDDLAQSADDTSIFLTYEWVSTWWLHFGGKKKMHILLFEKNKMPVGIIPLMVTRYSIGPFAMNVLDTIGAVNDNRVWIISPKYRDTVIQAFLSYLQSDLTGLALITKLELVPEDSQFIRILRDKKPLYHELIVSEQIVTLAPYIPLHQYDSWDDYFSSLGSRRRKILRRKVRSLQKAHNIEYKQISPDNVQIKLRKLFELHEKRWHSVNIRSPFSDPKIRNFYLDLSMVLAEKGWLHFSYTSLDGQPASLLYAFVYNQKFLAATAARDIRYLKYSIGHIHEMYAIKEAIDKKLREYDFLRGDEPYKFYWTDKYRRYLRVIITRRRPWGMPQIRFLMAFIRLSERMQHRHSLKELYAIFKLERKERREKERMGLPKKLK